MDINKWNKEQREEQERNAIFTHLQEIKRALKQHLNSPACISKRVEEARKTLWAGDNYYYCSYLNRSGSKVEIKKKDGEYKLINSKVNKAIPRTMINARISYKLFNNFKKLADSQQKIIELLVETYCNGDILILSAPTKQELKTKVQAQLNQKGWYKIGDIDQYKKEYVQIMGKVNI